MLGQRRRRWANIKPTLAQRLVLLGVHCDIGCASQSFCLVVFLREKVSFLEKKMLKHAAACFLQSNKECGGKHGE